MELGALRPAGLLPLGVSEKGFCKEGHQGKAMVSGNVNQESTVPSLHVYKQLLQDCTKRRALGEAIQIHAHLERHGLESRLGDLVVATLVNCGSLSHALRVFGKLAYRSSFSWTAIISGYINSGQWREALSCYGQMQQEGVRPSCRTFVKLLKACCKLEDLEQVKHIHADIRRQGSESDPFVGSTLISVYAKCGSIVDALQVFERLPERDVVSWNAMLAAYARKDRGDAALQLFGQMLEEKVDPDARTFVSAVQACSSAAEKEEAMGEQNVKVESLKTGRELHAAAILNGFDSDVFVGSTLVSMYAKCGSLEDAQWVFDRLSERDVVSWNSMIAAYAQQNRGDKALHLYVQMQAEGITPNVRTFVSALQACSTVAEQEETTIVHGCDVKVESLRIGKEIHSYATRRGCETDVFVGNTLVSMYARCGSIRDAQQVFERLLQRNEVSWTAIIAAYAQQGRGEEGLQVYEQMQEAGVRPDARTFVSALQACGSVAESEDGALVDARIVKVGSLQKGKELHATAAAALSEFQSDLFLSSTLVSIYGKCGSITDAEEVFYKQSPRNIVLWNAMLAVYAQQDKAGEALQVYQQMQMEGVMPNARTFVSVLQACGTLAEQESAAAVHRQGGTMESLLKGKEIHSDASLRGLDSDVFVGNTLVRMYAKCGCIRDAQQVFDRLFQRTVVSWNALLVAYAEHGEGAKALEIYRQMRAEGVRPDARTFVCALQACGMMSEAEKSVLVNGQTVKEESLHLGRAIHGELASLGLESDVFVGVTLLSMYAKCGSFVDAQKVFDTMCPRDVVAWTAMIAAYAQDGQGHKSLELYRQMQETDVRPDALTYVRALQACAIVGLKERSRLIDGQSVKADSLQQGREIHADVTNMGFDSDAFVGSTLVNMYANCGSIRDAEQVFGSMPQRDVVAWTAMIAAYAAQNQGTKALQLFSRMQAEGVKPEEPTFLCVLEACSNAGSLAICKQAHQSLVENGFEYSLSVANSLIHAYGKCGSMDNAQLVFDSIRQPDVVSWTALIAGYAREGRCRMSMQCYDRMCLTAVSPNGVTFLALLSACSHAGLVDKGLEYFEGMTRDHRIAPELEHFACVIDLVGRAGLFRKAEELLSQMPMQPDVAVWLCLLGACRKHANLALGKRAFDGVVALEPKEAAAYVIMSNMYSESGLPDSAEEIEVLRQAAGAWKEPGKSWMEHGNEVHTFLAGDHRHRQEVLLHGLVKKLSADLREAGLQSVD